MNGAGRIVVGPTSAELRRLLRPIEWMVLEEVALEARRDDGGDLVTPTSARRVAEHLGLTPGAVARALTRLRAAGLVTHARQAGPAGRFGLSTYVLGPVPGLEVVEAMDAPGSAPPCPAPPSPARPHIPRPRAVDAHMVEATPPGSDGADSSRRSLHDDVVAALAGAIDDLGAEEPAPTASPAAARRRRRAVTKPVVDQLSILDGAELAKNHEPNG